MNEIITEDMWNEFQNIGALEARVTALEDAVLGLLRRERNFAELLPEPEVAKSQQWLADRLSEAENSKDEEWLGEKNNPLMGWGHKDPDGDDDVRGLA
jgi:hypothetical protein